MNFIVTLLLMYFSLFGMNIQDPTPIYSVQEGLDEIRTTFPDWHEHWDFGEFDCSEMSMFVTNYFKIHGFDAELHHGKLKGKGHVWVVIDGTTIECTSLTIPKSTVNYAEYYTYSDKPKIYPTLSEIDWWNSDYIRGQFGSKFTQYLVSEATFDNAYSKDTFTWEKY